MPLLCLPTAPLTAVRQRKTKAAQDQCSHSFFLVSIKAEPKSSQVGDLCHPGTGVSGIWHVSMKAVGERKSQVQCESPKKVPLTESLGVPDLYLDMRSWAFVLEKRKLLFTQKLSPNTHNTYIFKKKNDLQLLKIIIIATLWTITQQHQKECVVVTSNLDGFQSKYDR